MLKIMIQRNMREEIEIMYTRLVLKPIETYQDRKTHQKAAKPDEKAPLDLSIPEVNDNLLSDIKDPNSEEHK
jgi:hypothetical protein